MAFSPPEYCRLFAHGHPRTPSPSYAPVLKPHILNSIRTWMSEWIHCFRAAQKISGIVWMGFSLNDFSSRFVLICGVLL